MNGSLARSSRHGNPVTTSIDRRYDVHTNVGSALDVAANALARTWALGSAFIPTAVLYTPMPPSLSTSSTTIGDLERSLLT